jgi:hypothetical protein
LLLSMVPQSFGASRSLPQRELFTNPSRRKLMKRLLCVLVLIVAGIVGLGFYQGWCQLASDSSDHKIHITATVDKDKFQEDEKKALEKVHDLGHQVKEKAVVPTEKSKDQAGPPVQGPQNQE